MKDVSTRFYEVISDKLKNIRIDDKSLVGIAENTILDRKESSWMDQITIDNRIEVAIKTFLHGLIRVTRYRFVPLEDIRAKLSAEPMNVDPYCLWQEGDVITYERREGKYAERVAVRARGHLLGIYGISLNLNGHS